MSSSDDSVVVSIRELHRMESERQESEARRAAEAERERVARIEAEREAVLRAESARLEAIEQERREELARREEAERRAHEERLAREIALRAEAESAQRAKELTRLEEHAAAMAAIEARRNAGVSPWRSVVLAVVVAGAALTGGYFGVYKPMARDHAARVASLEAQAARVRQESQTARQRADELAHRVADVNAATSAATTAAQTPETLREPAASTRGPRTGRHVTSTSGASPEELLRNIDGDGDEMFGADDGARAPRRRR
jgi:hypothetical protein